MDITKIKIDIRTQPSEWGKILQNSPSNDFILLENNRDSMIWFITNYAQFLSRQGGNEVVQLYGKHITDLQSFIYQANLSLPVGYELAPRLQALDDLLLNFETEPPARFIIWNDANHLYDYDIDGFNDICEGMIASAYSNRNGISTIKENGESYLVDQRNIFVFYGKKIEDIASILNKKYFIPALNRNEQSGFSSMRFNIIELC